MLFPEFDFTFIFSCFSVFLDTYLQESRTKMGLSEIRPSLNRSPKSQTVSSKTHVRSLVRIRVWYFVWYFQLWVHNWSNNYHFIIYDGHVLAVLDFHIVSVLWLLFCIPEACPPTTKATDENFRTKAFLRNPRREQGLQRSRTARTSTSWGALVQDKGHSERLILVDSVALLTF